MERHEMASADVKRAAERMRLACRAMSAAAADLRVARGREETMFESATPAELAAQTERVCEMADELSALARQLYALAPA
jgi:hypothetical protein